MNLLCRLSKHAAASAALSNQGFLFSRCRRCGQDLIRSSSWADAGWTAVPAGLRVAWRGADVSAFAQTPWSVRSWRMLRASASTALHDGALMTALLGCWAGDKARLLDLRARSAWTSGRRALRLPFARTPASPWVVVVHMSLGRDLRLHDVTALLTRVPPDGVAAG